MIELDVVDAARDRVRSFLDRLARLDRTVFQQVALAAVDADTTDDARAEADRLATAAGLGDVLVDARAAVRDHVVRLYDESLYRPTMVGLNWGLSQGTTADRIAAIEAAQDAVTAAVIEPIAPPDIVSALEGRFELFERSADLDASFDLGRATASGLDSARAGERSMRAIAAVVLVVVVAAGVVASIWLASGS